MSGTKRVRLAVGRGRTWEDDGQARAEDVRERELTTRDCGGRGGLPSSRERNGRVCGSERERTRRACGFRERKAECEEREDEQKGTQGHHGGGAEEGGTLSIPLAGRRAQTRSQGANRQQHSDVVDQE